MTAKTALLAALASVKSHIDALAPAQDAAPAADVQAKVKAKRRHGLRPVAIRMVLEGRTNDEILHALRARFGQDIPASYPAWYRADAVKRGLIGKDEAKARA